MTDIQQGVTFKIRASLDERSVKHSANRVKQSLEDGVEKGVSGRTSRIPTNRGTKRKTRDHSEDTKRKTRDDDDGENTKRKRGILRALGEFGLAPRGVGYVSSMASKDTGRIATQTGLSPQMISGLKTAGVIAAIAGVGVMVLRRMASAGQGFQATKGGLADITSAVSDMAFASVAPFAKDMLTGMASELKEIRETQASDPDGPGTATKAAGILQLGLLAPEILTAQASLTAMRAAVEADAKIWSQNVADLIVGGFELGAGALAPVIGTAMGNGSEVMSKALSTTLDAGAAGLENAVSTGGMDIAKGGKWIADGGADVARAIVDGDFKGAAVRVATGAHDFGVAVGQQGAGFIGAVGDFTRAAGGKIPIVNEIDWFKVGQDMKRGFGEIASSSGPSVGTPEWQEKKRERMGAGDSQNYHTVPVGGSSEQKGYFNAVTGTWVAE